MEGSKPFESRDMKKGIIIGLKSPFGMSNVMLQTMNMLGRFLDIDLDVFDVVTVPVTIGFSCKTVWYAPLPSAA